MDEGGGVGRHTEQRVDGYCLRTGVDDSGGVRRYTAEQVEGYYPCAGVDEGGGVRRHTIRNYLRHKSPPYAGFSSTAMMCTGT